MRRKAATLLIPGPRVGRSRGQSAFADFDWVLLLLVLTIAGLGLANLYSATYSTAHSAKFSQQVVWMSLGTLSYFAFSMIDYRNLHRWTWVAHVLVVLAILAVRFFFEAVKGSQRWIMLGPIRVQPTELAKLAVILTLARLLHDWDEYTIDRRTVIFSIGALVLPVLLVAWQPDLGSASLLGLIILSVSLMLVQTIWPIIVAMLTGLAAMPLLWERMHAYQQGRVLAFLDPGADPTGAAWQTSQSVKAIGSGQISGKGFMEATQNHFNFLPEHWTDFPFSVWAEEWGFLGSVGMLMAFLFLVLWIVNVGIRAQGKFGQAICLGVAAMIFFHTVVNILMVTGWAPVVGVPLPLISYGGSSVLTIMTGLGLVSSVSKRRREI
ncbi:MAG: rod shape-determining protein RodA [Myxococcales bacterium]|nr:rod shape-determining protein RodA [Myxococcales bacterium]